jgi:isopentenyl diphosphate isomerase/L-lactate dehydrogenase-like FMN-dependent dehydrogenase
MEETAKAMGDAPRWFQLYWSTSNELVESLVSRAGTVRLRGDRPHARHDDAGWRIRDLDLRVPAVPTGQGHRPVHERPRVLEALQETLKKRCRDRRVTLRGDRDPLSQAAPIPAAARAIRSGLAAGAVRRFVETYSRPSLSWDDLAFLRERRRLPILLKGSCTRRTRSPRSSTG